jgi:hypothetical protein
MPVIGPGDWPSLTTDYRFATCQGAASLVLSFAFDPSAYAPPAWSPPALDPADPPGWQQRALTDQQVYRALAAALALPEVAMSVATTLDARLRHRLQVGGFVAFAKDAATYLDAVVRGATAPVPWLAPLEVRVAATNPADVFPLEVELTVAGLHGLPGRPAEAEMITPIAPRRTGVAGEPETLERFAADLEAAYAAPPVFYKVASGHSPDGGGGGAPWIVRLRTARREEGDLGVSFEITGPARYYAPRPLARAPVSRGGVPIIPFDPRSGLDWAHPVERSLSGSIDTWGRQALAALDRFLAPDLASPAFLIDQVEPEESGHLEEILAVKEALSGAIASTVVPVLVEPGLDPSDGAPVRDARETMRRQILEQAENAYSVSAICQFQATVSAGYAADAAGNPRFRGPVDTLLPVNAVNPVNPVNGVTPGTPVTPVTPVAGDGDEPRSWTLTPARPELVAGESFVTSAITVLDPRAQSHLPLELGFTIGAIEPGIECDDGGESPSSASLALVIPFSAQPPAAPKLDTSIGAVDIPVVLREIPKPASLISQEAQPVDDSGADEAAALDHARSWRYAVTYGRADAAQDEIDLAVAFNLSTAEPDSTRVAPGPTPAAAGELDLFDHLARLIVVWPQLEAALVETLSAGKLDLDRASPGYRRARRLVGDLYALLAPLPAAWTAWRPPPAGGAATSAELTALAPADRALLDGETVWTAELDVAVDQNASATIGVLRNHDLLGGVDGQTAATTADFVYASSVVGFGAPAAPRLESERAFDVGRLSSPRRGPLVEHVRAVLGLVFTGAGEDTEQLVGLEAEFHQAVGPGLPPAVLPILLAPPAPLSRQGAGRHAAAISDQILAWWAATKPPAGDLCFKLRMFPTLGGSGPPLLALTRLLLAAADVAEL